MSRSKRALRPITLEELENSTALTGLEEVLKFDKPALPDHMREDLQAAARAATRPSGVRFEPTEITVPSEITVPLETAPRFEIKTQHGTIKRAVLAQDGHSMAENTVYQALWGNPPPNTPFRNVTVGYRALAKQARVHWHTVRRNLESLEEKLALETIGAHQDRVGHTYRVYSYRSILERRKEAGLVWYLKDRSGVRLFRETDLPQAVRRYSTPLQGTVISKGTVISEGIPPVPSEGTVTVISEGTLLGSSNNLERETSSSAIAAALMKHVGHSDDRAVRQILADCRKVCADATAEEIVLLIAQHASRFRQISAIDSKMGMLIRYLPLCFEGESFRLFRQERKRQREAEQRRREAEATERITLRKKWKEMVDDPNVPEEDKKWARELLEMNE